MFLKQLTEVVKGDDAVDNDAEVIRNGKIIIENKFRTFMMEFNANKDKKPSPDRLKKLETLKKEVTRKNAVLDSLLKQLKEVELEVSLRNGTARKREVEEASKAHPSSTTSKRVHLL